MYLCVCVCVFEHVLCVWTLSAAIGLCVKNFAAICTVERVGPICYLQNIWGGGVEGGTERERVPFAGCCDVRGEQVVYRERAPFAGCSEAAWETGCVERGRSQVYSGGHRV